MTATSAGTGTLWLVATPIGNLGDLQPRAVSVLAGSALVCCEDTRRTGRLLQHAGVRVQRLAVANEHTETSRIAEVLDLLASGMDVAVVTDARHPGRVRPGRAARPGRHRRGPHRVGGAGARRRWSWRWW